MAGTSSLLLITGFITYFSSSESCNVFIISRRSHSENWACSTCSFYFQPKLSSAKQHSSHRRCVGGEVEVFTVYSAGQWCPHLGGRRLKLRSHSTACPAPHVHMRGSTAPAMCPFQPLRRRHRPDWAHLTGDSLSLPNCP